MALIIADRVLETTTTTGTGALALLGATAGYQDFDAVCANNDTIYYAIEAINASGFPTGEWEVGLGTFTDTDTLTRTTVLASSNAGAAVNLSAGTKRVFGDIPATFVSHATDYRIGFFFTTAPTASEVLLIHIATDAFTLPANFATPDSKGVVGTNPTGTFALDVQRQVNATGAFATIGTISISTGGAFTFTTAGGTSKAIAVNDVIRIVAPAGVDATIANCAITLRGTS